MKNDYQCRWKKCRQGLAVGFRTKKRGDIFLCEKHSGIVLGWEGLSWLEKRKKILQHTTPS